MKKKLILLIFLIVFLISIFFVYKYNTIESVALRYFEALSNNDTKYVKKIFDIEYNDIINEETLESYIATFNISSDYEIKNISRNGDIINIDYKNPSDDKVLSYAISMERTRFLIFNVWKVYNNLLIDDISFQIPENYKLYVDNILVQNSDYKFPYLYNKIYNITLKNQNESIEDVFDPNKKHYKYELEQEKELINIDYKTFMDLYNSNNRSIIILGSSDCSHCIKFKPVMRKASYLYNTDIYFFDISKMTEDEYLIFKTLDYINDNFTGTPTTILVSSKKVIDVINGYTLDIEDFFENNGY